MVRVYKARAIGTYIGAMDASLIKAEGIAVPRIRPRTIFLVLLPESLTTSIPILLSNPYFTSVDPIASDPAINQTASWA